LKKLNGKVEIFTVGMALKTLTKNGDAQAVCDQLMGYENLNTHYVFYEINLNWR
jgi:hypothetical protein